MNAGESRDEFRQTVLAFVVECGRTLESHAVGLKRHEENIKAAHRTMTTHFDAIQSLRTDAAALVQLVNEHTRVVSALQAVMLRVLDRLGMDAEPPQPPPSMPN